MISERRQIIAVGHVARAVLRYYARRDDSIRAALDAGESYAEVARRFHLSRRQVIRIGKNERR